MKNFSIKQRKYIVAITIALTIILLVTSIVNIVAVSSSKALLSQNPVVDIVSSVVMLIVALVLNLFTFCSKYSLLDSSLKCTFALFIKLYEFSYDEILLIRQTKDKNILLIYVKSKDGSYDIEDKSCNIKANIYSININQKQMDNFISSLKEKNNKIIYEII